MEGAQDRWKCQLERLSRAAAESEALVWEFFVIAGHHPDHTRISATRAIQLTPRSTGERWECGEQMLSRAGGLNRGAKIVMVTTLLHHPDARVERRGKKISICR